MKKRGIDKYLKRLHKSFWQKAGDWLVKTFIPHHSNNHLPHAIRIKALKLYALFLITAKVFAVAFLFVVYPTPAVFAGKVSDELIILTNQDRAKANLPALKINAALNAAAEGKVADMIANGYFSHTAPSGDKPWVWLDQVNYPYTAAGENLAKDFSSAASVEQAFLASPAHRKNILNPRYQEIGLAVAYGELDGKATAVLVEFFGATEKKSDRIQIAASNLDSPVQNYEKEFTNAEAAPKPSDWVYGTAVEPNAIDQKTAELPSGQALELWQETAAPPTILPAEIINQDWVAQTLAGIKLFFYLCLGFLTTILLIKILVKIRIQYPHIIGYTLTLILFIIVITSSNFHFLEKLLNQAMKIV
ncbi:MAG: CAP domain-containing protein [Patescibacteria group bacterium]